jgi:hypothetical protein
VIPSSVHRLSVRDLHPDMLRPHLERRPTWYQIVYNLAAHHANRGLQTANVNERHQHYRLASEFARLLASSAALTLLAFGQEESWRLSRTRLISSGFGGERKLARFLQDTAEPASMLVAAAVVLDLPDQSLGLADTEAWDESRAAALAGSRQSLLIVIDQAGSEDRARAADASKSLVECVERRPHNWRTLYNLACYFTLQERFDEALYYLTLAIERADPPHLRSVQRGAWSDPTLAALVENRRAAVAALVASAIQVDEATRLVDREIAKMAEHRKRFGDAEKS